MTKRMLISVDRDESRAAVIENGQLVHLEIEPVNRNTCKGNIYRAVVARVEPSLQSAFVDFGNDKQGFLPVGEIHPKLRGKNDDKKALIQELIKAKQEFLVQVVRDEIGQKGATLSTFISLPGRYLVLIPESDKDKAGVSRKLSDEARDRIKKLTEEMKVPEGFGLIVRTAGETATETELAKDLLYLTRQWEHITKKSEESKGATLLYAERSLAVRFVRDYFTKDIDELVIDDDETLHEVQEFLHVLMPRSLSAVNRYAGDVPLFARYGIEGKVEDVFSRQVYLPGGGSIVIDQTEAMVAIDVNSGRVKEKDIEETARTTNIEAAQEIARQMMLRDMGGLIVIDFIDMREKKYVREVEQALKDAFKDDKARTKMGHISEFGLLEMSRQRIKSSVNKGTFDSCPHCSGTGRMRSFESVAMSVLRRIYELVAQKRIKYVIATVPTQTARYLLNARRAELAGLERQYHLTIEVIPVQDMPATQVVIEHLEEVPAESGAERADRTKLLRVTQELDLVRNHLIRREETKQAIEAAAAKRGAKVDYAEIYKEVLAMAPVEREPSSGRPGRRGQHGHHTHEAAGRETAAAVVEVQPQVLEVQSEVAPQPRGLAAWFKSLFGLTEPAPAVRPEPTAAARAAVPRPQTALTAPSAAPSEAEGGAERPAAAEHRPRGDRPQRGERGEGRGDRHDRRDRREGRRGDRSDGREAARGDSKPVAVEQPVAASAPVAAAPTTAAVAAPQPAEGGSAAPAAEGSEGRRRRRRRRRGGGGAERSDLHATAGATEGGAGNDDDADDISTETDEAIATTDSSDAGSEAGSVHAAATETATTAATATTAESVEPAAAAETGLTAVEATEAAEEEPVDAHALMQAELARLSSSQAEVAAPATEPGSDDDAPKAVLAGKRFVIDLRTPKA